MNSKFVKIEYFFRRNLFRETNIAFDCLNKVRIDRVAKFNLLWGKALAKSEFYRNYKINNSLPYTIDKISQLEDFPVITKDDLRANKDLIYRDFSDLSFISTGGSSGEPFLFPYSKKDSISDLANRFAARKKWDLVERPKTLKLWGHSNVFGTKLFDKIKYQQRRNFTDWISNQKTINAYITDEKNMNIMYKEVLNFKPNLLIGYTSTVTNLSSYIKKHNLKNQSFSPKLIVLTSENVYKEDIKYIKNVFNCEVAIEYGLAESGVVAYSFRENTDLHIFQKSFIGFSHNKQLNLTCLDRLNSFPLIRYQTGDVINESKGEIKVIKRINGRTKETIFFKSLSGKDLRFSVIGITHILKSQEGIIAVQCYCDAKGYLTKINISLENDFMQSIKDLRNFFCHELNKEFNEEIDCNLFSIEFQELYKLIKNKKGTMSTLIKNQN